MAAKRALRIGLVLGLSSFPVVAVAPETASVLLTEARHELAVEATGFSGAGAALLEDAIRDAGFIVLGEEHGFEQVAQAVGAFYETAASAGRAPYLATENGEWVIRELLSPENRGSAKTMARFIREHPAALAFSDDPELELYATVARYCDESCDLLWGIDQPYGATHVLEQVVERAPDKVRTDAESLLAEAKQYDAADGSSRFLYDASPAERLGNLADNLRQAGAPDLAAQVADLAASARIYADFRAAAEGAPTGLRSNRTRELQMKQRFLRRYRHAGSSRGGPPRILVKTGANHAYRGFGPTDVLTLGNFLHEFAIVEGRRSLHVAIFPRIDPADLDGTAAEWAKPLMRAAFEDEWTLLDLRPLAASIHAGGAPDLAPELHRLIRGLDLALLFPRPAPSPRTLTGP